MTLPRTDLLLVGAGHGHLHLLRHAGELVAAGYRVRLLAPATFDYSGVASATAAGGLSVEEGRTDVCGLAARAGVDHTVATLVGLDTARRTATTSDGTELTYDVLSLNVGSVVAPSGMTVHPSTLTVKPLSGLADLDPRIRRVGRPADVTVVGGGASGLELAAHLAVHPDVGSVHLVEAGERIGPDLPAGARRRLQRLLAARGVQVLTGWQVHEVAERAVVRADGTTLPHDLALLATGLAAPGLLADVGLGDRHGVPVRATLQHPDHPEIHAVGDCAHFLPAPLPRIGVHGVRQGPVLLCSLVARSRGAALPVYEPQRHALAILDLGAGTGLAVRGRWWWCGTSALRLKRWIDRRWIRSHRA